MIFSAHGVSPEVRREAEQRDLRVIDATCPLVGKVHLEAVKYAEQEYTVLLVGHKEHAETIGTAGEAPHHTKVLETVEEAETIKVADPARVVVLTQTTLSVDDTRNVIDVLKRRFPEMVVRNDICYATSNRQLAVKALTREVEAVLVIGASNSSNCNRLREVAEAAGVPAYLVDGPEDVSRELVNGAQRVGIISGASTPEELVEAVVAKLSPERVVHREVVQESVVFVLPGSCARVASTTACEARLPVSPSSRIRAVIGVRRSSSASFDQKALMPGMSRSGDLAGRRRSLSLPRSLWPSIMP